ncbi:Replication factor C (RF-C) subunit [Tilletia horrida]|uniref:Replication factor C subunit 5 n=1 Tax=Tilletia horrida TaxID=155126 RepID=A0AAN6G7I2_9BASI|nr:Replication factor C (RF-C) subunit [Tilletia horrida]KAK0523666.1 Replication factor C (RF-C) subunit [Tilletia horrida]KAK0526544.1 Replication factor C (RF-C) subunit [Tilletia horrida]KAK0556413.1 Replication factor C (RF-C) subunit [Tilletia horrida]
MLFVDKYRPKSLDELHYHDGLSKRLVSLAAHEDLPHMLFYGPSGAGKKTRVMCLLRELFGPGVTKLKVDQRVFLTPSRRKVDVNIVSSNYHMELTPSDAGNYDRLVIQDILKEIAQTQNVDMAARHRFKAVVINEADALSRDAQSALRRTMEKYMSNLRLILCATSTSKIIAPIRSRCLLMRVGAPNLTEMGTVLRHVAQREKFGVSDAVVEKIYADSKGNMRKALLVLEALRMQSGAKELSGDVAIAAPDWETYAHATAEAIIKAQTPEQLLVVRGMLYELLVHCIPPSLILKTILERLVVRVDDEIRAGLVEKAAMFDVRCRTGSKAIFHLEAFVAQAMHIIKSNMLSIDWE